MSPTRGAATVKSPPALYWNESGQVNCAVHAPYQGSDTWVSERWQRVPSVVFGTGGRPRFRGCEVCRAAAGR